MSIFSLARWRPRHLLLAWIVYWIGLVIVTLAPAMPAIWRATHSTGNKGEIGVSISDMIASLTVKEMGQTTWAGSAHLLSIALWVAIPPLVLWALWLAQRSRVNQRADAHDVMAG